jgi:hypothetical protein
MFGAEGGERNILLVVNMDIYSNRILHMRIASTRANEGVRDKC